MKLKNNISTVQWGDYLYTASENGAFCGQKKLLQSECVAISETGWLYKTEVEDFSWNKAVILLCKIDNQYGVEVYPVELKPKVNADADQFQTIKKLNPTYRIKVVEDYAQANAILKANGEGQIIDLSITDDATKINHVNQRIATYSATGRCWAIAAFGFLNLGDIFKEQYGRERT